jgi:Rrf2 family protein
MKLSNGVEWGMHCCVSLSQAQAPVSAARLAELHGIPYAYLAKHLQALARAGVIESTAGRDGGYELTRPACAITMLDVIQAIDGTEPAFRCAEIRRNGPLAPPPQSCLARCAIARAMASAEAAWRSALATVTIADLATRIDSDTSGSAMDDVRRWLATC